MYSTRFNGGPVKVGSSLEDQPTPESVTPSLIRTLESGRPDKFRKRIKGEKERSDKPLDTFRFRRMEFDGPHCVSQVDNKTNKL